MKQQNQYISTHNKGLLVVLGAGESGVGAALLAKQKGWRVFVSDNGEIQPQYKEKLNAAQIEWEENQHSQERIFEADLLVKSPGISDDNPLLARLRGEKIPVISEIEFASEYTDAKLIGISGTNGKTTTSLWLYDMLRRGGLNAGLAGNVGRSFALQVAEKNYEVYVLELSSFQLDGIREFRPHIALLTNISPDHLDRYPSFREYVTSKFQIVKNQTEEDFFVYDADNEIINNWLSQFPIKPKKLPFSRHKALEIGTYLKDEQIIFNSENTSTTMSSSDISLEWEHNTKNAMAAATVAKLLKIRKETIRESLESFHGLEHRLEKVLKINNVQYINDSKATNINATYYALESMDSEVVWIVGGVDQGNDYSELFSLVNSRVKAIVCLGVDNSKILDAFRNCIDSIVETQSMDDAVKQAYKFADKGDTVLLSPACASHDLFASYEERGQRFKEAVRKL